MTFEEAVTKAKEMAKRDPGLAMYTLRSYPEIEQYGLLELCWILGSDDSNCSHGDARGFFELLDEEMRKRTNLTSQS